MRVFHKLYGWCMLRIKKQLERCIVDMEGDFVLKEAHYERELCKIVKWQCFDERYYDAHDGETYIEIKKGQGQMFFNMVRYAEIYLKIGTEIDFKSCLELKRIDWVWVIIFTRLCLQ